MRATIFSVVLSYIIAISGMPGPALATVETASVFTKKGDFFSLDMVQLKTFLSQIPLRGSTDLKSVPIIHLPISDGSLQRFRIEESPIMPQNLADKFPEIRTFSGKGVDDFSAAARITMTPQGFYGMILSASDTVYIDPSKEDALQYKLTSAREVVSRNGICHVDTASQELMPQYEKGLASGDVLSTYRIAVAAPAEYTQVFGNKVGAMSAIVTTLGRLNNILSAELSIQLEMAENSDKIIFRNPVNDPYPKFQKDNPRKWIKEMLESNQRELDKTITKEEYDVGFVFGVDNTTGSGKVGDIGIVCNEGRKGMGISSASRKRIVPGNSNFHRFLLVVAHEMGHQFGANHSFNGIKNYCQDARASKAAYEPGSGSTIMSYASLCSSDNVQRRQDPYFHTFSFQEIRTLIEESLSCGRHEPQSTQPPRVNAGISYAIPWGTPFRLKGEGTESMLTYTWEQFDKGDPASKGVDNGKNPLFRSLLPQPTQIRLLPNQKIMLEGNGTVAEQSSGWELLPMEARNMRFRLTARDNAGGVAYDNVTIRVRNPGPFKVLKPNAADTWSTGGTAIVRWDPKNTNKGPFNCRNVDIKLSTMRGTDWFPDDGGILLRSEVVNNGEQVVNVPNVATTGDARIMVSCLRDNIFYNVSEPFGICNLDDLGATDIPCECIIANDKIQGEWFESEGSSSFLFPSRIAFRKTGPAYGIFEGFSEGDLDYSFTEECDSVIITDARGLPVVTYFGDLVHPNCLMVETGFQRRRYYCRDGRNLCPPGCGR